MAISVVVKLIGVKVFPLNSWVGPMIYKVSMEFAYCASFSTTLSRNMSNRPSIITGHYLLSNIYGAIVVLKLYSRYAGYD